MIKYNVIFQTKKTASWLAEKMTRDGHAVAILSGDLTVEQRISVLDRFRAGLEKVLITTNVLARGKYDNARRRRRIICNPSLRRYHNACNPSYLTILIFLIVVLNIYDNYIKMVIKFIILDRYRCRTGDDSS